MERKPRKMEVPSGSGRGFYGRECGLGSGGPGHRTPARWSEEAERKDLEASQGRGFQTFSTQLASDC